jgi:hypothetical protein
MFPSCALILKLVSQVKIGDLHEMSPHKAGSRRWWPAGRRVPADGCRFGDDEGVIFEPANGSYYLDSPGPLPPAVIDSGPISIGAGDEYWDAVVGYDSANPIAYPDALVGYEVYTTIGSFTTTTSSSAGTYR